ncbi:MAG: DUF3445 domain-containing protein [Rhodobacteraceae bacterium]|nr:DUF3445 domain-containing protein [Paracoccaceae bacterium]
MAPPLQSHLPYDYQDRPPLPGVRPLDPSAWLIRDEAFEGQMAARDRLIAEVPETVLAMDPSARPAAEELLDLVLATVYPGTATVAPRPDGVAVPIDRSDPMECLGRLVQEDLCIMEKHRGEHVLTAAALCFPANWMLAEKMMRSMIRIHEPISSYDDQIGKRVQRLFDGIQVGRPLWRFNALWYADPELHQPRSETARRTERNSTSEAFLRSERQCLWRLPETRAVVFSIHTYVVPRAAVDTRAGAGDPGV